MAPVALIKGYLPVRLKLPSTWSEEYNDETYFYIREHQGKAAASEDGKANKATLFVANAPVVPGVSTKVLLQSIFGRFTEITGVTVVPNPRGGKTATKETSMKWTDKFQDPSFLPPILSEGKYAHIAFASSKDLKKTMRALQDIMKPPSGTKKTNQERPGLTLERIEMQTLSDESKRQHRENRRRELGLQKDEDGEEDSENEEDINSELLTGIDAVAARYRANCKELSRERLLEECNAVMQAYEDAEDEKKQAQEIARSQPDDDGFVTVSYSSAVGSQIELEESATATTPNRRKGNKRSRKKKEAHGTKEQEDFYRFQRRENKKRTLEDLRTQFEEDLKRVKRMKDEHHYRPF